MRGLGGGKGVVDGITITSFPFLKTKILHTNMLIVQKNLFKNLLKT